MQHDAKSKIRDPEAACPEKNIVTALVMTVCKGKIVAALDLCYSKSRSWSKIHDLSLIVEKLCSLRIGLWSRAFLIAYARSRDSERERLVEGLGRAGLALLAVPMI